MLYPVIEDEAGAVFDIPNSTGTPERRLLTAILERAILDYVGNDEKEMKQAEVWIFGDLDESESTEFSFPWLCRELDLDVKFISAKIKEMPKRGSNRIAPWYFAKAS